MYWHERFYINFVPFYVVVELDMLAREVLGQFCSVFML